MSEINNRLSGAVSHAEWEILEISASRLPEDENSANSDEAHGEFKVQFSSQANELHVEILGQIKARMPGIIEYSLRILGRWDHDLGERPDDLEIEEFATGTALDEISAVLNYETRTLGGRLQATYPIIDKELLAKVREGRLRLL